MAYLKKDELETMRIQHVSEQNKRYHAIMTSIVNDAILDIDFDLLRKQFIENIRTNPEKSSISCFYEMKLHKLFGSSYSWRATKDGKGEIVNNPKPPYELWLDTTKGRIGSSSGKMRRYILDRNEISNKLDEGFYHYFYNEDPHIEELKHAIKEAFPDAIIILNLYNTVNDDAKLHIEIKMELEGKIPGLEMSS